MTNTNELTAKLKAAAHDEIMCREACDTSDLWQDEASPENVLALTEALEAANELNKHLELATRKAEGCSEAMRRRAEAAEEQRDSWRYLAKQNIAEREKDLAALAGARQSIADLESKLAQNESWSASAQSYIASLESRTLTVKLPHWSGYTCSGEGAMLEACVRSLESQGFTVQIEGE